MQYYTKQEILNIPDEVLEVCFSYCNASKNIYNSTLYIIKSLLSSYNFNKENSKYFLKQDLKNDLLINLQNINSTIDLLNTKKISKDKNKDSKDNDNNTNNILLKLYKKYEKEIDKKDYYQILNETLLNNVLKFKENNKSNNNIIYKDYTEVSSHISQSIVRAVIQDYKNYLSSLKSYYNNPNSFKAKPKSPNFKEKNFGISYILDIGRLTKEGILARVITKDNINKFTSIKDKTNVNKLYTCTSKKEELNNKYIEAYNNFSFTKPLKDLIDDLNKRHHNKKINKNIDIKHEVVELTFTPNKNYQSLGLKKVSVTATIKNTVDLNKKSKLYQILKVNEKFLELSETEQVKYIQNYFKEDYKNSKIMGIDMGQINHTTLAFNYQNKKSIVVASRKYNRFIKNKNKQLDVIKSNVFPEVVKNLQNKIDTEKNLYNNKKQEFIYNIKNNNLNNNFNNTINEKNLNILIEEKLKEDFYKNNNYPKLNKQEQELLNQSLINLYFNEKYIKTLQMINNYKDNYLHKLSTTIIDNAVKDGVDYIVIGRNIDWKQNINIGKRNNSTMYNIAHYKLIQMIKYKALKYGIVVLTTEESYTSKTSFINNSTLLSYEDKKFDKNINDTVDRKIIKNDMIDDKINSINANPEKSKKRDFGGIRKNRIFKNKSKNKIMNIHSDVNGAFNIMKKVFKDFKYHKNLNIYHHIVTIESNKTNFKYIT